MSSVTRRIRRGLNPAFAGSTPASFRFGSGTVLFSQLDRVVAGPDLTYTLHGRDAKGNAVQETLVLP
jgi:hypothetical protein